VYLSAPGSPAENPKGTHMNIIDWILDLFRSEDVARAFVAAPEQTLRDAGLAGVSAAQLSSVATTAVPGLVLGDGDPIVGLQRAVSNQYGFAPAYDYSPANSLLSPSFAPETNTELASHNDTDLLSHNNTPLLSPDQDAGANAQQGAFNLGFGDITLGDKSTNTATNGGVVVGGENHGDIVSGDGAVLGNNNDVNNGDVWAGTGSNVAVGHSNIHDSGTTATGDATVIKDNSSPVLNDVDASGGNGGGASAGSGGGLIGIGGSNAHGGNAGGGGIVINDPTTNNVKGNQTHVGGDNGSGNSVDSSTHSTTHTSTDTSVADSSHTSVHESAVTDSSVHQTEVTDNSSQHSASVFDNQHDTLATNSHLQDSHDLALASGNHFLGF
jgi:hypothetical protein